jgi:hypothetical protein
MQRVNETARLAGCLIFYVPRNGLEWLAMEGRARHVGGARSMAVFLLRYLREVMRPARAAIKTLLFAVLAGVRQRVPV